MGGTIPFVPGSLLGEGRGPAPRWKAGRRSPFCPLVPTPTVRSLYGLRVQTDVPLGVLPLALGDPDVVVRYGPARELASALPAPGCFEARPGLACFLTLDGTVVAVRDGSEVVVEKRPESDPEAVASFVLGQGLAAILHQRRVLTLHASAVGVGSGAVAFVGDQGAGKTTMAAALCGRGYSLVSDDVLALPGPERDAPVAHGGYPFLKVTEATAQALDGGVRDLDAAYASVPKWKRPAPVDGGRPLRALYVLRWGDSLRIRALSSFEALSEVARHSFAAGLAEATGTQAFYLHRQSALVRSVPVFEMARPRSLDRARSVAATVADHAHSLSADVFSAPPASTSPMALSVSLTP